MKRLLWMVCVVGAGCDGSIGEMPQVILPQEQVPQPQPVTDAGMPIAPDAGVPLELAWDAPTLSADGSALTDLAGYRLRVRAPGGTEEVLELGMTTRFSLPASGERRAYRVTAVDTAGNLSAPSNEVSWP